MHMFVCMRAHMHAYSNIPEHLTCQVYNNTIFRSFCLQLFFQYACILSGSSVSENSYSTCDE